jgi:hypothetical protein
MWCLRAFFTKTAMRFPAGYVRAGSGSVCFVHSVTRGIEDEVGMRLLWEKSRD